MSTIREEYLEACKAKFSEMTPEVIKAELLIQEYKDLRKIIDTKAAKVFFLGERVKVEIPFKDGWGIEDSYEGVIKETNPISSVVQKTDGNTRIVYYDYIKVIPS